jgi:hypothetical protein
MYQTGGRMKKAISVTSLMVAVVFLFAPVTQAQHFQGGINFMIGVPQSEFRDNVDNNGYGVGVFAGYNPAQSPLLFGLDFGFLIYGNENRKEPFSTTIPDVTVDVETSNNIVIGNFLLRLQNPVGVVRPYIDGLVGFNYLFTQTKIKNEGLGDEIATSTNFDDITLSYGGGGGIQFQVYHRGRQQMSERGKPKLQGVLIDLRVRYLAGGKAEYLKEGSIKRENSSISYDVQESRTDLLYFQIGAVVVF